MSRKKTSPRPSERCGCGDSYRTKRFFFTEEEVKRIINAAAEPERTLYWLAAETGLRAGELFGLRAQDVNLEKSAVTVHQAVWNRQVQTPKTDNANREFALSPDLGEHLRTFSTTWRPNPLGLLFTSRSGLPLDRSNFVVQKLWPLLDSLGISRCGLHAFRHYAEFLNMPNDRAMAAA
jgi:integrase